MSLFKAKEWWSSGTVITESDVELFNHNCIKLSQLGIEGAGDNIIMGNLSGLVQIYKPHGSYQPTHVVLENMMTEPVLHIDTGKLVFGSELEHIAVLHPKKLSVYSLLTREGQAEFGNQNILSEQYHHVLSKTAYSLTIGPFGGVKDKDFACVQSLDGLLMFFEQDVATFSCYLPDVMLPAPVIFSQCTDSFITCTSNWMIESFSYHNLSQTSESGDGRSGNSKKVMADWIYNLGEHIKNIHKVQTSNHNCSLVMLGDRSLYCLSDNGTLKFMKRFEFEIVCSLAYLVGWYYDPNSRLMTMVVTETSTILIYEQTTLLWSCQLTFLPLAIARGFFSYLPGSIVTVTDYGEVKCFYLGTEPELFTAPPLVEADIDFDKAQEELESIQSVINNQYDLGEINLINKAAEREIPFSIVINPNLELNDHPHNIVLDEDQQSEAAFRFLKCSIGVSIRPLNKDDIQLIQVTFIASSPLKCSNPNETIYFITDEINVKTDVFLCDKFPLSKNDLFVVVLYTNSLGNVRILRKQIYLPLKFLILPIRPLKEAKYKVTISTDKSPIDLMELFKDFDSSIFSEVGGSSGAIAFESLNLSDHPVTIITAKSSQRYRLQSDGLALMGTVLFQLMNRLREYFKKKAPPFTEEAKKSISLKLYGSLSNDLTQYFVQTVERHSHLRKKLLEAEKSLDTLSLQFILVQKRLMIKYREKPPTSCEGVYFLLQDTHKKISMTSDDIQNFRIKLLECGIELSGCIKLILILLQLMEPSIEDLDLIKCALTPDILHHDQQDWEETVAQNVVYLLQGKFSKTDKDRDKLVPFTQGESIQDFDGRRLIKYIRLLFDRFSSKYSKNDENAEDLKDQDDISFGSGQQLDTLEEEKILPFKEDNMLQVPEGSLLGYNRKPILTARWEKQQKDE